MHISNKFTINSAAHKIWDILSDPRKVGKLTPGVEGVEADSPTSFIGFLAVKLGPVKLRFKAHTIITESDPPKKLGYAVEADELGKAGSVTMRLTYELLTTNEGSTELRYECDISSKGKLSLFGDKVIASKWRSMEEEMVKSLNAVLQA